MKNSQKNIIIWVLVAVIVLLLITFGAYYSSQNKLGVEFNDVIKNEAPIFSTPIKDVEIEKSTAPSPITIPKKSPVVTPTAVIEKIKIISPNGGELWITNTVHQIVWNNTKMASSSKVDLYLIQPRTCGQNIPSHICLPITYVLDKNIDMNNQYNWIVGTDIINDPIPPDGYLLRICMAGTNDNCDESDQYFSLLSPIISQNHILNITSPKGNESVKIGDILPIEWNVNRLLSAETKFVISGWGGTIGLNASATTTSYQLTIPKYYVTSDLLNDVVPGQYKIKVSVYDGKIPLYDGKTCSDLVRTGARLFCNIPDLYGTLISSDESDGYFTITN